MKVHRLGLLGVVVGFAALPAFGGVTVSTVADGPSFPAGFAIASPTNGSPQALTQVNQQPAAGTSLTQTFRTGASGFQLDRIEIYSGGKSGGTARLNIYPDPVGGEDADGFVNTSFSTDLLNGGVGLDFTFNGSPGAQYLVFDLTGLDEITLAANQQYAIEIDVLTGQFSWQRSSAGQYPDGNLYSGGSEQNFGGTPPAGGRGERFQVGGTPQRDGFFALYAVPEPSGLALLGLGGVAAFARNRRRKL